MKKIFSWLWLLLSPLAFAFAFIGFTNEAEHTWVSYFLLIDLMLFGIGGVYYFNRYIKHPIQLPKNSPLLTEEQQHFAAENLTQVTNNHTEMKRIAAQVQDKALANQLRKMQFISQKILDYMNNHPEKITLANQFIDYYQPKAIQLTRDFTELEATGLTTPDVQAAKQQIIDTLSKFDEAYEAQFSRLLSEKLLNLNAELTIANKILHENGIENTNTDELPPNESLPEQNEFSTDTPDIIEDKTDKPVRYTNYITAKDIGRYAPPIGRFQKPVHHMDRPAPPSFISNVFNWGVFYNLRDAITFDVSTMRYRRIAAGLAGIFFGSFGTHKFLLGHPKTGLFYILTMWTGIPYLVGLVQGIYYICMSDEKFYEKYYLPKFEDM